MRLFNLLVAVGIAVAASSLCCTAEEPFWPYLEVCKDKLPVPELLSQVKRLSVSPDHGLREIVCNGVKAAYSDLKDWIGFNDYKKMCVLATVEEMQTLLKDRRGKRIIGRLPKHGVNLVNSVGHETAALCKAGLLQQAPNMEKFMAAKEIEAWNKFELSNAVSLDDSVKPEHTDVVDIAINIVNMFNETELSQHEFEHLGASQKQLEQLKSMKEICRATLQPLYSYVLGGQRAMYRMGIRYGVDGPLLEEHKQELNSNVWLRRMLNMMLTCEALRSDVFDGAPASGAPMPKGWLMGLTALPDKILVNWERDEAHIKESAQASSKEAEQWAAKMYEKYLSLSTLSTNKRYLLAHLKMLVSKLR